MYNKEIKKSILLVFLMNIISIRRETNLKNLLKYFKGSAIVFAILAPLSMIVEVAMDLLQPTLLSKIIDVGVAQGDINYILKVGFYMIMVSIIAAIGGILCSFFASAASMKLAENLRESLFKKVNSLSFKKIDQLKTASLITRLTNDETQVQQMFNMMLRAAVRSRLIDLLFKKGIENTQLFRVFLLFTPKCSQRFILQYLSYLYIIIYLWKKIAPN